MQEEYTPTIYPTELLPHVDWSKRKFYFFPQGAESLAKFHDMHVRDDDVWVVTLPKCGTTWMQELVWLVMNDFDFERAKSEILEARSPFLEFSHFISDNSVCNLKPIEELKSPRLIKSHLPLPLLPHELWSKKPKVIYVYRDPKDYIISLFYHEHTIGVSRDTTLEQHVTKIVDEECSSTGFDHVTEFYALRNEPWIYYTSFEQMKKNLRQVIEDICEFLNKSITEEQMKRMLRHLAFEEMKDNPMVQHISEFEQIRRKHKIQKPSDAQNFIRKGESGGYKKELSAEVIDKIDNWITQNLLTRNITLDELLLK